MYYIFLVSGVHYAEPDMSICCIGTSCCHFCFYFGCLVAIALMYRIRQTNFQLNYGLWLAESTLLWDSVQVTTRISKDGTTTLCLWQAQYKIPNQREHSLVQAHLISTLLYCSQLPACICLSGFTFYCNSVISHPSCIVFNTSTFAVSARPMPHATCQPWDWMV